MALIFNQLLILLWKSWITRLRHWISTLFELSIPLLLALAMAYLYYKAQGLSSNSDQFTEYEPTPPKFGPMPPELYSNRPTIGFRSWSPSSLFQTVKTNMNIMYGPSNADTNEIMQNISRLSDGMITVEPFDSEQTVNTKIESLVATEEEWKQRDAFAIIFDTTALREGRLNYTIRMVGQMSTLVNRLFPYKRRAEPTDESEVNDYANQFCRLQIIINHIFVTKKFIEKGEPYKLSNLDVIRFPYPAYEKADPRTSFFNLFDFIAATIAIGYVILCPLIVKRITDEKVTKAKEMLRMIGMSDWVFWLSHFISYFMIMVFHAVMFTAIYFIGFGGYPVFEYTNSLLFFVIFIIYSVQTILFCMTLTTVFNRPVLAVITTVIFWILSYAVPFGVLSPAFREMDILETNKWRILSSFLPNMGLTWALAIIGQMEVIKVGAQWSTLFSQTNTYGSMTLGLVMFSMLVSCLLYVVLIWYVDNVWPFQYGVPKSVFFPFSLNYWCPSKERDSNKRPDSPKSDLVIDTKNFEAEPESGVAISVTNLTKVFGGFGTQKKTAVDHLSLNIYEKQITALLGHNGAGKTTAMNMITGIFPPSSGKILVNGYDIQYETSSARKSIGLCPQENIYFNELTVGQHLKLFAILKGCECSQVDNEVKTTLELLQLKNKIGELAQNLSGGMKRKLMLGIALVGGTQILILDEPTSGLDPEARRVVWDLLQTLSKKRTILLTTHYMEEADVLGDRIAIMSEGKVKCCGSPMFLKKRFGAGYHFRVSKAEGFRSQLMEQTLKKYLPKAHLHSEIQSEVIYALESENETNAQNTTAVFPKLFDEIEKNKEKLGISSCGLTITTMEDVFIRVGNEFEGTENVTEIKKNKNQSMDPLVSKRPEYLSGFPLLMTQFYALLLKRIHFAKRDWMMFVFQLIVPAALFTVALLTDNSIRSSSKGEVKNLDLSLKDLYGNTYGFFKTPSLTRMADTYVENAKTHGMETTRLSNEDPNDWALKHSANLEVYTQKYLVGGAVKEGTPNEMEAQVWYNNEALHSMPLSINLLFESFLKYIYPEKSGQRLISVHNHPLPSPEKTNIFQKQLVVWFGWAITCILLVPITVPFLGASYVLFPISERISKAKLLQLMTGLSSTMFWFTNFVFDLVMHSIVVIIIYIIFAIFDYNRIFFAQTNTAIGLFLMLFLFGFASIPLAYCFSLVLGKPSTGFAVLVIIYLLFGVIAIAITAPIDFTESVLHFDVINNSWFTFFVYIFRMIPVFSMSFGIQRLYRTSSLIKFCNDLKADNQTAQVLMALCLTGQTGLTGLTGQTDSKPKDFIYGCCTERCSPTNDCYADKTVLSFDEYGVGTEFLFLIGSGLLFMALLLIFEMYWFRKLWYRLYVSPQTKKNGSKVLVSMNSDFAINEDSDVSAERERIRALEDQKKLSDEAMAVIELSKNFGYFTAVDHLTFGIHKEECFGLLGVNGAGKTTTFQMLTGDLMLSEGNAFINSYSVREDMKSFQKQIGYCPQFDALLDKLSGSEMLYLFARLRGIPSKSVESEVTSLIKMVDLQNHAYKRTETYSGGNRRKLSLALAIIGSPAVIFLDEPTAGVDPTARRKIWSTLVLIQERYQSSIVLTSHSMEECEALCSRIGIMVNGQFRCLGPVQHLRKKFGQGFTIIVKLKREVSEDSAHVQTVKNYIQNSLTSAVLKDIHQGLLHFHITDPTVQWSYMFAVMEKAKQELHLEDYLVSDTTLEQIFLAFAKTQR